MGRDRPAVRKRPRKVNRRAYFALLKAILITSFVVYALYYFSQSSFFALRVIEVRGLKHLVSDEVAGESGLIIGANIFRLDLGQAGQRLLTDPWIEGAELRRRFPDRVEIDIRERQPAALLLTGQNWLVLDRNGICIDHAASLGLYDLPIITGLTPDTTDRGGQVSASEALLSVLAAMNLNVENFFSEVDIGNPDNLIAYSRGGIPVLLGRGQDMYSKLLTAQSLMVNIDNPDMIKYIDLRSVQAPAVKYVEGKEP